MSKVLDFSGVDDFCPGGFLYSNLKRPNLFSSLGSHVDVYFSPRKRSRISAPFVLCEKQKPLPSIEILPDECLFEVFRRLPGGQERSACAGVSKRWLMLLSTIKKDEMCAAVTSESVEPEVRCDSQTEVKSEKKCKSGDGNEINTVDEECLDTDSCGYLSRCLEGKKATDVRLAAIAVGTATRGGLGKLSIRGSKLTVGLTDLGLKAVSRGCPSLKVLSLWKLPSITDDGLCEIASENHSLEKLDLCHCPAITDKGLIAIAMNCPNLKSVAIESCPNIGNESLQALGRYCSSLKCVSVKNCPLVGDQGIASLFSSAGHIITRAKLQALNITDVSLAVIGHYGREMTDLSLIDLQNINERGFWVMGKGQGLKKLESLSITACRGLSDPALEALAKGCPDLKLFALRKCSLVSDKGLVLFAKAAGFLESLHLEECHCITGYGVLGTLANCGGKLKAIALTNCLGIQDVDSGFLSTSRCDSLRSLTIRNCPKFGDAGLGLLGRLCPNLTHVDLTCLQRVTDTGVYSLIQCLDSGLEKLTLTGCVNLTDNVVTAIAKLHGQTLELLNLDGCKNITDVSLNGIAKDCSMLSDLDVSHSAITDSGISILAGAKQLNLQVLSIAGCRFISNKSLPFLGVLGRTLIGLNIQQCIGISSGSVDTLLEQLWRCDILS